MKRIIQILILTVVSLQALGQVSSKNLNGEWTINNKDSSYYHSDTIKLVQDIIYLISYYSLIIGYNVYGYGACRFPSKLSFGTWFLFYFSMLF